MQRLMIFFVTVMLCGMTGIGYAWNTGEAKSAIGAMQQPSGTDEVKGSVDNFKSNRMGADLNSVMGDNDGQMKTLDGKTQFDAKIACAGNDKIAEVTYGFGGGNVSVNITYASGGGLSFGGIRGICPAGFTICDGGTNTRFCNESRARGLHDNTNHPCNTALSCRQWALKAYNKTLVLEPLAEGGCDVVSAATLSQGYDYLTSQISAALSGAFTAAIADVKTSNNGSKVVFNSQSSENCNKEGGAYGSGFADSNQLKGMYQNDRDQSIGLNLQTQGNQEKINQQNNPDSIYNLMKSGDEAQYADGLSVSSLKSQSECKITTSVGLRSNDREKTEIRTGTKQICTDHWLWGRPHRIGNTINIEFRGGKNNNSCDGNAFYNCPVDATAQANGGWFVAETYNPLNFSNKATNIDINVRLDYSIPAGGGCNAGSGNSTYNNKDAYKACDIDALQGMRVPANNIQCPGGGGQYPIISYSSSIQYKWLEDTFAVNQTNECASVKKECTLLEEDVCDFDGQNCIRTWENGIKKGENQGVKDGQLVPIPRYCKTFTTTIDTYEVCSDGRSITATGKKAGNNFSQSVENYSHVKRKYQCPPNEDGFGDTGKALSGILDETGETSKTVKLSDISYKPTCTVKRVWQKNQVLNDGSTNAQIGNSASEEVIIKECTPKANKATEFECKLEAGESIQRDCTKDNPDQLQAELKPVVKGIAIIEATKKYTSECKK